jgi:hypothetical protein
MQLIRSSARFGTSSQLRFAAPGGCLVLGHSLHDEALISALLENVIPRERLAVTVLASEEPSQLVTGDGTSVSARVLEWLPGAAVIPVGFDPSFGATGQRARRR